MEKKFEFTDEVNEYGYKRIRALRDIPLHNVKKGDLGGFLESENNLHHDGDYWVGGNAIVYGNANISGDAFVSGNAIIAENARVLCKACVYGNAKIFGNAFIYVFAQIYDNAWVAGNVHVSGNVRIFGSASVSGNVHIAGNTVVYNDARVTCGTLFPIGIMGADNTEVTKSPIFIQGLDYFVSITDKHMQILDEIHTFEEWQNLEDTSSIDKDWWLENKEHLMFYCSSRMSK
jgi:hypothetical protein